MSFNIKKSLEVDYLAARTISSRDFQTNQNAPPGHVLTATESGNARWVISPPVNAFSYIVLPDLSYSTIVGFNEESLNTFQLQASEPLTLSVVSSINRIIVGGDFSNFVSVASLTSTVSGIVGSGPVDINGPLTSTVAGLGQTYVSIASLTSTVAGIRADPVDISIPLTSTVAGLGRTYVSIPSLTSTVAGLGKTYVSIPSLTSTVAGLGQTYISIPSLTSTVSALGDSLTSTVAGLGQTYVSIPSLTSTVSALGNSLTSTVDGLGQTYVSIPSLTSTVSALGNSLTSTVAGLGQTYVSIPSLTSTVAGLIASPVDISIPLASTTAGLGQIYISIPSLTSTVAGLSAIPVDISIPLASTVAGLGQTYVSIPSLTSTVAGLGQTYVSVPSLASTVAGLGQTYVSVPSLTSTMTGISNNLYVSSLVASTFTVTNNARIAYVSTLGISSASITAGVGSASAPSYSFGGDTNNGIFSPLPDMIAVTTSGVERLRVDDVGRVGVGKSAGTGYVLDVSGTVNAANYGDLYCISGANVSQAGGTLAFGINQFPNYLPMSQLKGVLVNSVGTELQGGITFSTRPFNAGASGELMTERMRINEDGTIGIGSNITTTATLDVSGTTRVRGNVAIGRTVNAGFGLDVSGIVRADYFSTISISSGFVVAGTGSANAPTYSFAGNATAGIYRPSPDTVAITTAGVERLRVDSGGLVGIGRTPATGYALDVSGGYGRIQNYINEAGFELLAGGVFSITRTNGTNGDAQLFNFGTGSINFGTNGTSGRMVIDSTGNVGINKIAAAGYALDVSGGNIQVNRSGVNAEVDLTAGGGTLSLRRATGVNGNVDFVNAGTGLFSLYTNSSSRMTIDGAGEIGINTTSPNSLLNIVAGTNLGDNSGNPLLCLQGGDFGTGRGNFWIQGGGFGQKMYIQSYLGGGSLSTTPSQILLNPFGGAVAIGTTTPSTNFDVSGSARIIQTLQTDSNITMSSGTAAAPSLTFQSDSTTGIFRPGPNRFGITVGGTSRFEISGNDFTMNSYPMYACRAWGVMTSISSFVGENIESITYSSAVDSRYTIVMKTPLVDSNYSVVANLAGNAAYYTICPGPNSGLTRNISTFLVKLLPETEQQPISFAVFR